MPKRRHRVIRDYLVTISAAVVVALLIRFFVIEAFKIPTSSMRPTLEPGDVIFVSKWSYLPFILTTVPERGQVVLYRALNAPSRNLIKRIVAMPGESVVLKQGILYINSVEAKTKLLSGTRCGQEVLPGALTHALCIHPNFDENFGPTKIPPDHVLVMSDDREVKKPKIWEIIPLSSLRGQALWIWLSIVPQNDQKDSSWFPRFRVERIFRRIR